ncbi:type II secretion system F family protein [Psychromicrobium lacuslunae]|uniref:type II secretion system F family protein n=1 Tax=Psychromicrobium lacuslunae TaxID=1618207 RepID=UPI000697CF9B|nr:type II secretion system F family protein [Psychromicrobium lacuslunae]
MAVSLDLLASMLDAGNALQTGLMYLASVSEGAFGKGLAAVASALRTGSSWQQAWQAWWQKEDQVKAQVKSQVKAQANSDTALHDLADSLSFVALSGTSSSLLLRQEAASRRRQAQRELQRQAAALGVRLVLPMGLTALPAFFCLGVVPLVLALLPGRG